MPSSPAPERRAGERLQKVLARAGFGSRRACEALIGAGRVHVDGEVATLGRRVDPATARIEVDGVPVVVDPALVWYLVHKPAGVVTTARDPQGRPTVLELVPATPRVFTVGRLDLDSEGLILVTNDGDLAQRLAHPSHGVDKTYVVEVEGRPSPGALRCLRTGVDLDDGRTAPARVRVRGERGGRTALELTIHEGRKRQVRRMCESVGHPVRRLVRVRIGPLADRSLAPGQWRPLSAAEVRALYEAAASGDRDAAPTGSGGAPGGD